MVFFEGLRESLAGEELPPKRASLSETSTDDKTQETPDSDRPHFLVRPRDADYVKIERALGKGPMRFAPIGERSIQEQVDSLGPTERACFDRLKAEGETVASLMDPDMSDSNDELYLRFARCADFQYERAAAVMKNWLAGSSYFSLRCSEIEEQLSTETLFIPPGLKTRDGLEVFYMRPSRYFPKETPTLTVISNLAYIIQVMEEKEESTTKGVAFLANMNGWTRHNFSLQYCFEFMQMLQGHVVPAKVQLFLIVDPPTWFDIIWSIMQGMLSTAFAQKVHMIKSQDLPEFLEDGHRNFLPDDMGGKSKNKAAVLDFVRYRRNVEGESDVSFLENLMSNVGRG